MNIRPLSDRIIVKRLEAESTSPGGIIIPDVAQEKPAKCEVLAVGRGRITDAGELIEPAVKVGDVVLVGKYGGVETPVDGDERLFIREDEILAVLEA